MRLTYSSVDDSVKGVLIALHTTGLSASRMQTESPIVTLELDEADIYNNPVELMGDLAIIQYLLTQSPTPPQVDSLEYAEWVALVFGPQVAGVTKASCKTDYKFLETLRAIEDHFQGDYIGGTSPSTADILLFTRLNVLLNGNAWLAKRYPRLASWFILLQVAFDQSMGTVGENPVLKKLKKKKGDAKPLQQ
mmetsp:Transcript_14837/g.27453  ORF Transcript_14837/g.27453 Transcript_14837/m.27453 type:complete len:192 (-) Transcript_14837:67-642(-)